jgi:uncharacterized protein (TIGR02594 family)
MNYQLVIFLTLLTLSYSQAATKAQQKAPILRSVFKPHAKKPDQIELIRLYQDKSFEHLIYSPDQTFKGGVTDAIYYKVLKNTGQYALESGKMKLTCMEKNFPCKLYGIPLFVDNSKVYDNRFRALFMKKEFVLRSVSKSKYNQPYFIDPENGRIVTNESVKEVVDLKDVVHYAVQGETEAKFKLKAIVSFLRENIRFTEDERDDEDELAYLLSGNARKAASAGLAKLFSAMLNSAGVPAQVVQGELKADLVVHPQNKTIHFWNSVRVGNANQLYDISLSERWMNVDPAIMIHSHFPEDSTFQHLEVTLTKSEFNRLPYSAPTRENSEYTLILPGKSEVHIKDQMELLLSTGSTISHAEIIPIDVVNSTSYSVRYTTTSIFGKTRVVIPIKEKNALLSVRTSSGMEMTYRVYNDGIKDAEIETYYQEMRSAVAAKQRLIFVDHETVSSDHRSSSAIPAILGVNAQFRADILMYQLNNFTGFDHPLIRSAIALYGTKEIVGVKNNPKIVEFFQATGQRNIHNDETHWCSAFIMYCAKMNGFDYPKNALARSWMRVGEKVEKPEVGDLVVFGWGESYHGHVVIYLGEVDGMIIGLGGNQDDQVNVMPFSKESILGYRRLN